MMDPTRPPVMLLSVAIVAMLSTMSLPDRFWPILATLPGGIPTDWLVAVLSIAAIVGLAVVVIQRLPEHRPPA